MLRPSGRPGGRSPRPPRASCSRMAIRSHGDHIAGRPKPPRRRQARSVRGLGQNVRVIPRGFAGLARPPRSGPGGSSKRPAGASSCGRNVSSWLADAPPIRACTRLPRFPGKGTHPRGSDGSRRPCFQKGRTGIRRCDLASRSFFFPPNPTDRSPRRDHFKDMPMTKQSRKARFREICLPLHGRPEGCDTPSDREIAGRLPRDFAARGRRDPLTESEVPESVGIEGPSESRPRSSGPPPAPRITRPLR